MKVMNIENPQEFLKVIDSCSGQVELVTAVDCQVKLTHFFI